MAADVPNPSPLTNPIGTPFDAPATADDLTTGQPGVTLFSLLKGILLQLITMNNNPADPGN